MPIVAALAIAALAIAAVATSQDSPPRSAAAAPSKPAPRMPSGKPDLSGVWDRPYVPDMTKNARNQRGYAELPFTPAGLADWRSYDAANGDYTGSCLPYGMTRSWNSPFPLQIVQTDALLVVLFELNTWFYIVPIDGRPRPKDPEPTWYGTSAGRWDGDTLVIDTVGFNGYTRLDTIGHPHSDGLHLVQTLRRTDLDHMAYTVTVDDPEMYARAWTNERTFTRMDGGLIEYSCEENNKDLREGHIKAWTMPPPKKKP
jgi:hypothetical protein